MNRRDVMGALTGLAAAATIPLAGCSTAVGEVPAPEVPDSRMDGWTRIDEARETLFEEAVGDATIEAKAHTVAYEDEALRDDIEGAIGELGHPVSILAASRVAFSGGLGGAAGTDDGVAGSIETAAAQRFESRLRETGIENVERTGATTVTVESGAEARYRRYVGDLPLDTLADAGSIDSIAVAGDLATWWAGESSLIVGAAYPAESFADAAERGGRRPGDVDLEFDAAAYREDVRTIVTAVE